MSWRWFGVKTAYRTEARGRPKSVDSLYDPTTTLVEERVVLIRARGVKDAIRRAEKEARRYVHDMRYRNAYGERVRQRYLGACDVFELFEIPGAGIEVFSSNRLVSREVTDRAIVDQLIGPEEPEHKAQRRWRFLNYAITCEFSIDRSTDGRQS